MQLDDYFRSNYSQVLEWATSIYRHSEIDSRDVVAELYIDLSKRTLPPNDKEMKYYILRWLKSRTYWQGGNAINNYKIPEHSNDNFYFVDMLVYEMEQDEVTKDLYCAGFNQYEVEKINSCIEISKGMPLYYKRLFVLYYIDGMTMEQIGRSCGLPKSAIFTQLKKVQEYLKTKLKFKTDKMLL